jgi:hypothetical protein
MNIITLSATLVATTKKLCLIQLRSFQELKISVKKITEDLTTKDFGHLVTCACLKEAMALGSTLG